MPHIYNNPSSYSINNQLQHVFAKKLLDKITIHPTDSILDIGCGDGSFTADELAASVPNGHVIGTDISPAMIEHAKKTHSTKYKNLQFIQMSADNNIFLKKFDVVTSFNALHWVKNQTAALIGIANAAAENARIALLLSHKKSTYHHALELVCKNSKWQNYFTHYESPRSFFEIAAYKKLLENAGLNIFSLIEEEMIYTYPSAEKLKDFFCASMAQIKQIPEHLKKEFLDDVAQEFITMLKLQSTDSIPVSFWCLQIIART